MLWEEIIKMALANGIWAVLFCSLLFYQIKDNHRREARYHQLLGDLSTKLGVVKNIQVEVRDIKDDVKYIRDSVPLKRGVTKSEAAAKAV